MCNLTQMASGHRVNVVPWERKRLCPHNDCKGSFSHLAKHYRRKHGGELPRRQRLRPYKTCSLCDRTYSQGHRKRHYDTWHPSEAPKNAIPPIQPHSADGIPVNSDNDLVQRYRKPSSSYDQTTSVNEDTRRSARTDTRLVYGSPTSAAWKQRSGSRLGDRQGSSGWVDPSEEADLCLEFARLSQEWRQELLTHWKQRLAKLESRPNCRQRKELQHHIQDLERVKPLVVMSATQYRIMVKEEGEHCFLQKNEGHIVLCHWRDAKDILSDHSPLISILVPHEWALPREDTLNIDDFWLYLRDTKAELDVHVPCEVRDPFDKSAQRRGTSKAVAQLQARGADEINFLNLATTSGNVQPKWTSDVRALQLLPVVPDLNVAGKESRESLVDLSNCTGFHICSNHGTASLAHWDRQGCSTFVRIECGRKPWIQWRVLKDPEAINWAHDLKLNAHRRNSGQNEIFSPKSCPSLVPLRTGDEMYQPRGTVHAPASMRNDEIEYCLATGAMMWDIRDLPGIARQSLFEHLSQSMVTNEEPANEFRMKAAHITGMWSDALKRGLNSEQYFSWGSADKFAMWKAYLMVSLHERVIKLELKDIQAYNGEPKGCNCNRDCQKNKCPCKLKKRQCTVACHILPNPRKHGRPSDMCRNMGESL